MDKESNDDNNNINNKTHSDWLYESSSTAFIAAALAFDMRASRCCLDDLALAVAP